MRGLRKRWAAWLAAVVVAFGMAAAPVSASFQVFDENDAELGHGTKLRGGGTFDDGKLVMSSKLCMPFSLEDFVIVDTTAGTTSTLGYDGATSPSITMKADAAFIQWFDNEEHPVQKTFHVPDNYLSGPEFRVLVGRAEMDGGSAFDTLTPPAIDFEVFVNADLTAFDAAATNQTAVTLTTDIGAGSPEQKTLTVATDFASLAANDWITWNLWRDDTNTSTDHLELYGAEFCYTALD